ITDAVTVMGPPAGLTIVSQQYYGIFAVDVPGRAAQPVSLSGLTLANGSYGVFNRDEAVTLSHVNITGCLPSLGAASVLDPRGSLTLRDCVISGNSTVAVFVYPGASASLLRCTVANNVSTNDSAGAIRCLGSLFISNSLISGNRGGVGGGLYLWGKGAV